MNLFPPEIINHSPENHWVQHSTQSKRIYMLVLFALVLSIVLLPFISVKISTQARGIIRTPAENNSIAPMIAGEIVNIRMHENLMVKQGDTLLILDNRKFTS
jgi:HlyD family secretion protein